MTEEHIAELRHKAARLDRDLEGYWLDECLDEIERLQDELKKANRLPDSMQEAFNSGDGTYKP